MKPKNNTTENLLHTKLSRNSFETFNGSLRLRQHLWNVLIGSLSIKPNKLSVMKLVVDTKKKKRN